MKFTNKMLKQIIKEELESVMTEMEGGEIFDTSSWDSSGEDAKTAEYNADKEARDQAEHVWLAWLKENYPDYREIAATDDMVARFKLEQPEAASIHMSDSPEPVAYDENPFPL
jgi:hypothetical protein